MKLDRDATFVEEAARFDWLVAMDADGMDAPLDPLAVARDDDAFLGHVDDAITL